MNVPREFRDLVEAYRRDGFVHLHGFVPPGLVRTLTTTIESTPERDPGPNPLTLDTMRFASNLFYASPPLQAWLSSPGLVALLCAMRGPDLWVRWDQAVWKGNGAPLFPWHQDNGYTELDVEHTQVWLALTPMNAENGGLQVVPGAHVDRLEHCWVGDHVQCWTPDVAEERGAISITAAPGDVVVFSSWLPHATTPNVTGEQHLAYVAEFLPVRDSDGLGAAPTPRCSPRRPTHTRLGGLSS